MNYKSVIDSSARELGLDQRSTIARGCPIHGVESLKLRTSAAYLRIIEAWWCWHNASYIGNEGVFHTQSAQESAYWWSFHKNFQDVGSGVDFRRITRPNIAQWLDANSYGGQYEIFQTKLLCRYITSIHRWGDSLDTDTVLEDIEFVRYNHAGNARDTHNNFPLFYTVQLAIVGIIEAFFSLIILYEEFLGRRVYGCEFDDIRKHIMKHTLLTASHHNIVGGAFVDITGDFIRLKDGDSGRPEILPKDELHFLAFELQAKYNFVLQSPNSLDELRGKLNELLDPLQSLEIPKGPKDIIFIKDILRIVDLLLHGEERVGCPALFAKGNTGKIVLGSLIDDCISACEEFYLMISVTK